MAAQQVQYGGIPSVTDRQTFVAATKGEMKKIREIRAKYALGSLKLNTHVIPSRNPGWTTNDEVSAQDIYKTIIDAWSDLIKFGDERVL